MKFIEEKVSTICQTLKGLMVTTIDSLEGFEYTPCGYKTNNTPPKSVAWELFDKKTMIGGRDVHYWFRKKFKTPQKEEGKEVFFELLTGKEGTWDATNPQCIVYLNGEMVQGMDVNHTTLGLNFDTEYDMNIYLYSGMIDTLICFHPSLKLLDKKIEKLYYDLSVPLDSCRLFDKKSENYAEILKPLDVSLGFLDLRQPYSKAFYESLEAAADYLSKEFYDAVCKKSDTVVNCIGHTHIDVAWLWTLEQTREKTQRSFATVINLMKEYPEYKFMSSQPQLYKYVKESAPALYKEIKEKVKEGRWEVEGAMWLEADCNLISGESLIRQIMFGKQFMKEEFGVESKILWLPDVFGYSAAMPQILKKCGVEKFVTSKISWNEFNKLPYDTFMWEGIDGTDIFTYFITARDKGNPLEDDTTTTYVGYIRPKQVLGTWERYQQKEYNKETLITFGFGDGGGGPTKDMLEQQRRLAYGIPGLPTTKIETAGRFLEKVEQNFKENSALLKRMPKWVGELYLELHRGTYTSIAKNKKNNRKSELVFQQAESLCVAEMLLMGGEYPQENINQAWETILLNQFHDIIPGSSIFKVYEECDRQYKKILDEGTRIMDKKIRSIAENVGGGQGVLVYNPNGFVCNDVIDYKGKKAFVENIPSFGWKVVEPAEARGEIKITKTSIENNFFKVKFDENGNITSILDKKNQREAIKQGEYANRIEVFEDYPKCYDAWEITNYYKYKMWTIDDVTQIKVIDEGARAGVEITKKFLNSTITQKIFLYEDIGRIDFKTSMDWHEEHLLVKTAFPFDIHASKATYDIQFGNIERTTHENTSWDQAKFEVCAHKWADISEDGYGISLMNDCKYGYSAEGSTLKLTLLKCATYPNPQADKGLHEFTYSIYPHKGDFKEGKTISAAYALNMPLLTANTGSCDAKLPSEYSLVNVKNKNIVVETVKKAENSDDIIIRFYEAHNRRCDVTMDLGFDFISAVLCDMLENDMEKLEYKGRTIIIPVKNYEIITIKLKSPTLN